MIEVTRDEFYACMGPLDVHPHPWPNRTEWKLRDRRLVAVSFPGYMGNYIDPAKYLVEEATLQAFRKGGAK